MVHWLVNGTFSAWLPTSTNEQDFTLENDWFFSLIFKWWFIHINFSILLLMILVPFVVLWSKEDFAGKSNFKPAFYKFWNFIKTFHQINIQLIAGYLCTRLVAWCSDLKRYAVERQTQYHFIIKQFIIKQFINHWLDLWLYLVWQNLWLLHGTCYGIHLCIHRHRHRHC